MAKEIINENEIHAEPTSRKSNVLYREHLEYVTQKSDERNQKFFWNSVIGLGAITIYAAVAWLVVQQLRK